MPVPEVVYILLRFPYLTETFIAEEIRNIQMQGLNLRIYSLLRGRDELIHPVSQRLLPQVRYAPGLASGALWLAQAYYLFKSPGTYLAVLRTLLKEPSPRLSFLAKRMDIFLKSVWLARELERTSVELLHTHFAWLSAAAAFTVSRLLGLPFTFTAHAYDIYSEKNDLLRLAARSAGRIITISEANKQAILAMNPGLPPERVVVLHCGIDLNCFRSPPARPADHILQITSVGSLLPKKGHEFLIRACHELLDQHVDFQCVIAGSGRLQQSLADLIDDLGLEKNVTLAGARPQDWIRDQLAKSDLFILASVTEGRGDRDGIPVAIMEAMAMGVPVVSTRVSGIPELVRDEETGLLVAERDPHQLATAIMRLASDEPLRQRVVKNALDLVTREYDITRNTAALGQVFQQAIRCREAVRGSPA